MNEQEWLKQNKRGPVDQLPFDVFEPGTYNPDPVFENTTPDIVNKLGIMHDYLLDGKVKAKAIAIENFLRKSILLEEKRDSSVSYETILERLTNKLPEPLERLVTGKRGLEALNFLFKHVALGQEMSGESFLKVVQERIKHQRVSNHLHILKQGLTVK